MKRFQDSKILKITILACFIYLIIQSGSITGHAAYINDSIITQRLYVGNTGSNSTGDGTQDNPFNSIQYAIDIASEGDTIVVLEGTYSGYGNINLNFRGKELIVRSHSPQDDDCLHNTIINTRGQGVIVKFVNDEGPSSVFMGFTLISKPTNELRKGVNGFFEFSQNARPTIKRIRVGGTEPNLDTNYSSVELYESKLLSWNGRNPFQQPANTTNYYGSGDVDGDGSLTTSDESYIQNIVNGLEKPNARADVDGNGLIELNDISLLNDALNGSILPAWWDYLPDESHRNFWIDRILEIDQTEKHPYECWFVCANFSKQLYIRSAFERNDLSKSFMNGGSTVYNIPIYTVSVQAPGFGHAVNGVLIGDNPLNFEDWRFIEPQNDTEIHPGDWNMPFNSRVQIINPNQMSLNNPSSVISYNRPKVYYLINEAGWTLQEYDPSLILTRPIPSEKNPDNRIDFLNPNILPIGSGKILFEQIRDDLSRINDIHLSEFPNENISNGKPLTLSSQYSRILDTTLAPDGRIHILWVGKEDYSMGVYHGVLLPQEGKISDITRVSDGTWHIGMGRITITSNNVIHIFWLELDIQYPCIPFPRGIYWTQWNGSGWQPERNLTPELAEVYWSYDQNYTFDVTSDNNKVMLIWADPIDDHNNTKIYQKIYDGNWGNSVEINNVARGYGVEIIKDNSSLIHLFHWKLDRYELNREDLVHQIYDGNTWSSPIVVDQNGGFPRAAIDKYNRVFLVWERQIGDRIFPVWNQFQEGKWNIPQIIDIDLDATARFPTVSVLSDGKVVIAWNIHKPDQTKIDTFYSLPLPKPKYFYLPLVSD